MEYLGRLGLGNGSGFPVIMELTLLLLLGYCKANVAIELSFVLMH